MTGMDPKSPIYSSSIIANYIEYIEKHLPEIDVDALLDHARIGHHELSDEGHWLTQDQVNRFHEILEKKSGDPDIPRTVGRYAVFSRAAISMRRHFLKFINPLDGLKAFMRLYPKWSRSHLVEISVIAKNQVEISIRTKEGFKEEPFQCRNRIGIFEAAVKQLTGSFGEIDHPDCIHRESDHCRYIVTFKDRPSAKWIRFRRISLVAMIPVFAVSFFFLPQLPWLSFLLLVLTGYLGLTIFTHHLEKDEFEKIANQFGDAAEKHFEETKLRYNNAMLIQEIGKAGTGFTDVHGFIDRVVQAMKRHLDFCRGMIMLLDESGKKLTFSRGYGMTESENKLIQQFDFSVASFGGEFFGKALIRQQPVLINDISKSMEKMGPKSRILMEKLNVKSIICIPMVFEGKTLGLLFVDTPAPVRVLTRSDMGVLNGLASQAAIGIVNAGSAEKLRESEEKYRILAENVTDVIWILSVDTLKFEYVSPSVEGIFGYTPGEYKNLFLEDVLEPKSLKQAMESLTEVIALSENKVSQASEFFRILELEQYTKGGELVQIEISANLLLDSKGRPKRVIGISRDISRRKQTEKKRIEFEERLMQSQKMESLGVMAGSIAHNFNNLLMVVMGNLELAKMSVADDSTIGENLYAALKAAARAADLSTMMLTYVGQLKKDAQAVDFTEIVQSALSDLKDSLGSMIETTIDFSDEETPIYADRDQIRQVVVGIITNAIESFKDNSGKITMHVGLMHCDSNHFLGTYLKEILPEGRYAFFEVSDNGCGMDDETMQKIFDPYFSTKFTGRGLGLAAVLGIVRSHGGAISVDSIPGIGSKFKIVFPCYEPLVEKKRKEKRPSKQKKEEQMILLVDDDALVLDIGRKFIERAGFNVLTAEDGKSALDLYRHRQDVISCVLLDFSMPGMDGMKTMAKLRKINPDIKIIISSGYTREQIEGHLKGMEPPLDVIHKPFSLDTLTRKLNQALSE